MKRSHEIDMTSGPLLKKILLFTLPLIASGVLQLLFNAADVVVVGKFAGSKSLAAVGSNGSLVNLIINLFIGIATAANILVARYYGSRNDDAIARCVHSAMGLSLVLGLAVGLLGIFLSETMLELMDTDPEVLPLAAVYLKIYFLGAPGLMVYNFGAAILRAIGDTERPLRFLTIAGITNVILNLLLVVVFHLDVAGVAIATAISQYLSAFLVVRCLIRADTSCRLIPRNIRIHKDMAGKLLQIGIPIGLNSSLYSISNVLIQSSINSFGYVTMAANSAAGNIDGFVYVAVNSVAQGALSFTSQNYGARQHRRIKQVYFNCLGVVLSVGISVAALAYTFGPQLLSLYVSSADPNRDAIIATGMVRLKVVGLTYCLCGVMDQLTYTLRGMGKTWSPLIISALGACGFRILWIYTVFAASRSLDVLYLSYPISWVLTAMVELIVFVTAYQKLRKREEVALS